MRVLKDLRIHVSTSLRCDNACLFCMEFDERTGRRRGAEVPAARAFATTARLISRLGPEHRGLPVTFTGGEPTLNVELPMMAAALKQRGFDDIGLQTNGRRLGEPAFAIRLVKAGFNRFSVSLHGSCALVHEAATRARGSFAQTSRGLEVLLALKRQWPWLRLSTTTTVSALNVSDLAALLPKLLARPGLDDVVLNAVAVEGNGKRHFRRLALRYRELAAAFRRARQAAERAGLRGLDRLRLVDVPPCIEGAGGHAGAFERVLHLGPEGVARLLPPKLWFASVKGPSCAACARAHDCTGVAPQYAEAFGWSEFAPVAAAAGSGQKRD